MYADGSPFSIVWGLGKKENPVSTHVNPLSSVNPPPDLMVRAQHGDPDAFAALFETHKQRVYGICLRMTNNVAEAEDLTQDAFIHVFRKLSTFRGDSALSTWLYRIAVNTVLMHFRRKSGRQVSLDQPAHEDSGLPKREYGRIDERLAGCVDRLALARAIKELPPGYRMIFLLHSVEGLEHKEIAQLLRCSVGTSKSQLHKARLKMRELLVPRFRRLQTVTAAREEARVATEKAAAPIAMAPYRKRVSSMGKSAKQATTEDRNILVPTLQDASSLWMGSAS